MRSCFVGDEPSGIQSHKARRQSGSTTSHSSNGFIPVSLLGRRIVRVETAALTITAIVQYEWGDLGLAG